jgi:Flp pilus assembly protein TadG
MFGGVMIGSNFMPNGADRSLWRDQSGVAMIEFALTLPIVVVLGLGALETANLALAHLRVSQIAMTVADNAGRVTSAIDEVDIVEVFAGAESVGQAIDFQQNGRVVLSSLQDNMNTNATLRGPMINWQRCFGSLAVAPSYGREGKGRSDATLRPGMGPAGREIAALANTAVMFVEVSYNYQPMVKAVLRPQVIRYESAFNVRERTLLNITNTTGRAVATCPPAGS